MLILSIDSSATAASVALVDDNKLIGEFFINTELTHSRTLMPMIDSLLEVVGKAVSDIELIAVSTGPGSFTGVRIGVAAVKGLAFASDIPCMGVSTLESMAYNLTLTDCVVCAVMDARRDQVYNAMFRIKYGNIERLCEDRAISLEELKKDISENYSKEHILLVGDGARLTMRELMDLPTYIELAPDSLISQRASSVAYCAKAKIAAGEKPDTSEKLMPSYLRLSQAERERAEKENKNIN